MKAGAAADGAARLEQLHYTWSPRGAEGLNRFQIAAISAGLKRGPMAALLPVLRKVCRYDPPRRQGPGAPPISYGWFDRGRWRVAFCRVGLGDARGRRGNFAAHLLAGPRESLPESSIALRFESPFWWTGPVDDGPGDPADAGRDFELPAVGLPDLPPGPDEEPADLLAVDRLAHAIFTLPPGGHLAVGGDSRAFGRRLRSVARHFPQALEGISLSTYEGAATLPFEVVGTHAPRPGHRFCALDSPRAVEPTAAATLAGLRDPSPTGRRLRAAASCTTDAGDPGRRGRRWELARTIVAVASGDEPGEAGLCRALWSADGAAYVVERPAGRRRIAAALHDSAPGAIAALAAVAGAVPAEGLAGIGAELGGRYAESGRLDGCAVAAEILAAGDPAAADLLDAALAIALEHRAAAATLGRGDLEALLVRAAERGLGTGELDPLLERSADLLERLAHEARIPDRYVAAVFLRAAAAAQGPRPALLETLRARPALLRGATLKADLAGPSVPGAPAGLYDELAVQLLRDLLGSRRPVPKRALAPAADLLARSRSRDHPLAGELLAELRSRRARKPIELALAAGAIVNPRLRGALQDLAIHRAFAGAARPRDIAAVWTALARLYPARAPNARLGRLLDEALRSPSGRASLLLLPWLATDLLPTHPDLLSKSGRLAPDLQASCLELAVHLPAERLDQCEKYLPSSEKRIGSWLGEMRRHRSRRLRKHRRARPWRVESSVGEDERKDANGATVLQVRES